MKILIVDDAKETRESLLNIIKIKINPNYEIAEAENGLEALALVETFKPDIVLTDVLMPRMDGIRFTSILKSQDETKHIFIAAITGLSGDEQIQKIYASGVDFYIAKPFQLDDIVARLKVITSLIKQKSSITDIKPKIVYNCFNDEHIKHYSITFSIITEDDIFLIFDYFSKQNVEYNSLILKDFMVTLIKTYRTMSLKNRVFDIIIEESESYIYVTVKSNVFIKSLEQLVDKHSSLLQYAKDENSCSFRVDIISFLAKHEVKKTIYKSEIVSATELLIVTSDDIFDYVNELNFALQEYRSVHIDEIFYNDQIHLALLSLFEQYIRLFKKVHNFDKVLIALQSVYVLLQNKEVKLFNNQESEMIFNNLETLNQIIELWIEEVITKQTSINVHYYDNQIMNSCRQVEKDFS